MKAGLATIATALALAGAVAASAASAAAIELTVDSSTGPTLFAGPVTTLPHAVDGSDGSGPHPCTGPSATTPAATATGALDDAMRAAGISWRGNWNPSFRDFFIDRIGPYASAEPDSYWSLTVNGQFSAGGCLARIADGDSVRFHYGPLFGAPPVVEPDPGAGSGPAGGTGTSGPTLGPSAARLRGIARRATRFLRGSRGVGVDWARLALTVRRGQGPAAGAAALLGPRLGELAANGSLGRDVNATAVAALALAERQPRAAARAARWLASVQGADGGFGFRPGLAGDVDTTGLAAWALARAERKTAVDEAVAFLRGAQSADGGFPALPGGDSNAHSTGLALVALRAAGDGPRLRSAAGHTPLAFLASLARREGSISYSAGSAPTPTWTTAQALLGLTSARQLLRPMGRFEDSESSNRPIGLSDGGSGRLAGPSASARPGAPSRAARSPGSR